MTVVSLEIPLVSLTLTYLPPTLAERTFVRCFQDGIPLLYRAERALYGFQFNLTHQANQLEGLSLLLHHNQEFWQDCGPKRGLKFSSQVSEFLK